MGMTPDQYWNESPYLAVAYRQAYKLRREVENEQAWIQGIYIYDAFAVCLSNAFAKRGAKTKNYFERPLDILPLTKEQKAQREQEEQEKMRKALESMAARQRSKKTKGD